MTDGVTEAIADGDLDELVRWVDRLSGRAAWDELVDLRDRAKEAYLQTGRQLWPAASLAEYRLALDAPGDYAARVLVEGTGHLALGPLPEVAATTHTWSELAPHVVPGPAAWMTAHERAARGEVVGDERVEPIVDLPLRLASWEPRYLSPTYEADAVVPEDPPAPAMRTRAMPASGPSLDDVGTDALAGLCQHWKVTSNGDVRAVAVEGDAESAVAALGHATAGLIDVTAADAVQRMAWAAASGGAHGRRRGAAVGRFDALWAVASLVGLVAHWPVDLDELGELAGELRWCLWSPAGGTEGWTLHVAVEDPYDGVAWALSATDET